MILKEEFISSIGETRMIVGELRAINIFSDDQHGKVSEPWN